VEAFINHLDQDPTIVFPIGDIIILSHGRSSGEMKIALVCTHKEEDCKIDAKKTTYEVLEKAVECEFVRIPDALHANGPNPPVEFDVHIRGCRIGQSRPFVEKLREAFHSPRSVTAPLHMHYAYGVGPEGLPNRRLNHRQREEEKTKWGSFEHLGYAFELFRPDVPIKDEKKLAGIPSERRQFINKAEAVKAFVEHDPPFRYIKDKDEDSGVSLPVPKDVWEKSIPKDLRTGTSYLPVNIGINLGEKIGRTITEFKVLHEFRHEKPTYTYIIPKVLADPGNDATKEAKLREDIRMDEKFQAPPIYPFPVYERHGYADVEKFLIGYKWKCSWKREKKELWCVGTRHVYTVILPVVDPNTHNLLFNLFPSPKSPLGTDPVLKLDHKDSRLFLTVRKPK
jgi:hypothetical protein